MYIIVYKLYLVMIVMIIICDQAWENRSYVSTQNTLVSIMAPISCSVCAITNHLVLLISSQIYAYMMTFQIHNGIQIKSYNILFLNSQNQVKFYLQIRPVFPRPVTYTIFSYIYIFVQRLNYQVKDSKQLLVLVTYLLLIS